MYGLSRRLAAPPVDGQIHYTQTIQTTAMIYCSSICFPFVLCDLLLPNFHVLFHVAAT